MGTILNGRVWADMLSVREVSTTPVGTWSCPETASTESSCRSPMRVRKTWSVPVMSWDSPTWSLFTRILTPIIRLSCRQSTQWVAAWNSGESPSIQPACFPWRLTADYEWHHRTLILSFGNNTWCSLVLNFCLSNLVRQLESPKSDTEIICTFHGNLREDTGVDLCFPFTITAREKSKLMN